MKIYTTISGDTFDKIALSVYDNEYLFPQLLQANPRYRHILIFSSGIELIIPDIEVDVYYDVPTWLEDDDLISLPEEKIELASEEDS